MCITVVSPCLAVGRTNDGVSTEIPAEGTTPRARGRRVLFIIFTFLCVAWFEDWVIYTIICLKSVDVRKLQVAILARSPREMSETDRILPR